MAFGLVELMIAVFLFYGFIVGLFLYLMSKTRVLVRDSKDFYKLKFTSVKEGFISIKDYLWDVRNSKPKTIKGILGIGTNPFYILDYLQSTPIEIKDNGSAEATELITPKMLGSLVKNETLRKFLSEELNRKELIMFLFIGLAIGFFAAVTLVATGVIPLGSTTATTPPAAFLWFLW